LKNARSNEDNMETSNKRVDVIVVGAGPAGLMAAREASRQGVEVVLLEKEKDLGLKVCGEAVSGSALDTAEIPSSDRKRVIMNKIGGCYIYSPNETRVVRLLAEDMGYGEGYILDKPFFLRRLAEITAEEGVTIQMNSEVKSVVRDNGLISGVVLERHGETERLLSKTVIGCDGFNSTVLKDSLGILPRPVIPCVQYKMVDCRELEKEMMKFYIGREVAPSGYVWVFPTGETTANVGIGARGGSAKKYLDKFIEKHDGMFGKARILTIGAAPVPICGQLTNAIDDNLLVCGDASGQVIPFTGGGIHSSLGGGKMAGRIIAEALSDGDTSVGRLKRYWDEYEKPWGFRIKDSAKALKAIETLTDKELTELGDILSSRDIVDLVNGFDIARVAKLLLAHPVFALKISEILLS
jgi:digeranylgeranylglycerophospholipid reductase